MKKYNDFTRSMRVTQKFYKYVKAKSKKTNEKVYTIIDKILDFYIKNNK